MTAGTDLRDAVLADLRAEGDVLETLVSGLEPERWRLPTPAPGWAVAHQVAHLAWTDEVAVLAATDERRWAEVLSAAVEDPDGFVDRAAVEGAALEPADLLGRWRRARAALDRTLRELPEGTRIAWFGPPMSPTSMATARLMETWAHTRDVADALGTLLEPTERIQHVAHLGVRTRDYAFVNRGLPAPTDPFRIELRSPAGQTWTWGPEDAAQSVRGTAYDFCLLVTRRRHRRDLDVVAVGPDAEQWLDIAQCFAGPSGAGRRPGSAA